MCDMKQENIPLKIIPTKNPAPPDGGWGWVVAVGASVVQMQVATLPTTFGVYFAHLTTGTRLVQEQIDKYKHNYSGQSQLHWSLQYHQLCPSSCSFSVLCQQLSPE